MQNFIIKLFSNFLSYSKRENNLESFNELNSQNIILDISLYSLQNSLLDVRINLFVFIIEILDTFENNNVFLFDILNIKEIKIFIENNIIPKYYLIDLNEEKKENKNIELVDYEKITLNNNEKEYLNVINKENLQNELSK